MSKHAERTHSSKPCLGASGRRSRQPWPQWVSLPLQALYLATSSVEHRYTFHHPTSFSATDGAASRSASRGALKSTTYVTVKVNGKSRVVLGEKANMTTVKDVLETGDIVLDPEDSVTPSLDSKVSESTVISINRANTTVETTDTEIASMKCARRPRACPRARRRSRPKARRRDGDHVSGNPLRRSGRFLQCVHLLGQEGSGR